MLVGLAPLEYVLVLVWRLHNMRRRLCVWVQHLSSREWWERYHMVRAGLVGGMLMWCPAQPAEAMLSESRP
jgi:hypothetical protein